MPRYISPILYLKETAFGIRTIEGAVTGTAGFVGTTEHVRNGSYDNDVLLDKPTLITSWAEFVLKFGRYHMDSAPYLPPAVKGFFDNGGRRCYIVRVRNFAVDKDYMGGGKGAGNRTGLQALKEIDEVNIVCIPGVTSPPVQQAMIRHCETMGDRSCILDPLKNAGLNAVSAQRYKLRSERGYGALYYPWIKVALEVKDGRHVEEFVPPSGHIAGIYARIDTERGVHKAPANAVVKGALKTTTAINKADQDILNQKGINCIRTFPSKGIRVWGARTISNDPEWKYINVRRFFNYVEESIEEGTEWVVFEPNDPGTWTQVKRSIETFLATLWRSGMLTGQKPEEAFYVKCGLGETMTQTDIESGRLISEFGMALIKPAEFMITRISWRTLRRRGR